ncbi:MAG: glycosyltransferase [Thermosphaera sp.]
MPRTYWWRLDGRGRSAFAALALAKTCERVSMTVHHTRGNEQQESSRCENKNRHKGPLVSIIMPTYNHEEFIDTAIQSVLAQTYPSWELLVVDDGSTDRTVEIVRQYQEQAPWIRLVERPHKGIQALGENYNLALSMAKGELIAILEGDDFWPEDKLEKQVPSFEDPDVVLTWGICGYVDAKGNLLRKSRAPRKRCLRGQQAFRALLLRNFIPTATVMARADVLKAVGFIQPRGAPFVDYPTWLELVDRGKLCFVDEILGFWRAHPSQQTRRLVRMWLGEISTYNMLWRKRRIHLVVLLSLLMLSAGKLVRRAALRCLPGIVAVS